MTDNTDSGAVSSPTSQEQKDAEQKRSATLAKATERLTQQADYAVLIDKAIASSLPELIGEHSLGEAVDTFVPLEAQVEALDKAVKSIKARMAYAREVSFPQRLDKEDMRNFTSKDTGHQVVRTARVYAAIPAANKPAAYEWLQENGYESLIQPTVNASALSAAAKELEENGKELPEEIFTVHIKDGISLRKGKLNG